MLGDGWFTLNLGEMSMVLMYGNKAMSFCWIFGD